MTPTEIYLYSVEKTLENPAVQAKVIYSLLEELEEDIYEDIQAEIELAGRKLEGKSLLMVEKMYQLVDIKEVAKKLKELANEK